MAKRETLKRTIAYYQLVDSPSRKKFEELDWNQVLRDLGTNQVTHHVFEKEIHGTAVAIEPQSHWRPFLNPPSMADLATSWHDDTIYALTVATDKDHIPNQRKKNGQLVPMRHDDDGFPSTIAFVWFLPFGNIFGVLLEDQTAVRPRYIASWLNRVLRDNGHLPRHNLSIEAVPVVDEATRKKLSQATKLSGVRLGGRVRGVEPSPVRALLGGGPQLEGSFDISINIRPVKKASGEAWNHDTERLYDWFEDQFGSLTGHGLSAAAVKFARTPDQDDLPHSEINLIEHRITRKRQVSIANPNGRVQAISAISAVTQIIEAYLQDFAELAKHR